MQFHVVSFRSDYLNMIGFQSDLHKNRIWADSLNEALEFPNKSEIVMWCSTRKLRSLYIYIYTQHISNWNIVSELILYEVANSNDVRMT